MYAADSTMIVTRLDRTPRSISSVMTWPSSKVWRRSTRSGASPSVGSRYPFTNASSAAASAWTTNTSYAKRLAADPDTCSPGAWSVMRALSRARGILVLRRQSCSDHHINAETDPVRHALCGDSTASRS